MKTRSMATPSFQTQGPVPPWRGGVAPCLLLRSAHLIGTYRDPGLRRRKGAGCSRKDAVKRPGRRGQVLRSGTG